MRDNKIVRFWLYLKREQLAECRTSFAVYAPRISQAAALALLGKYNGELEACGFIWRTLHIQAG